jgi:uncharacterized protein (TIGR02246 family)
MNSAMRLKSGHRYRTVLSLVLCGTLMLVAVAPAAAQKDKKRKNETPPPATSNPSLLPMSDEQQIDYMISTMLGAWQIGDVDKLHQAYADDVTIVNGVWAPPVIGWTNFVALYQQQRARMQQVRLDRTNTFLKVDGTVAWACYQWEFTGTVDGQPMRSVGQTTLVMEKRNGRWVIVHNHTSLVPSPQPGVPTTPGNAPPATQPPSRPGNR